ncbi:MAG: hypothetical protein JEZ03_05635 [Bacteroidales bacterium]|nr:hypothetical protein [Bacteroidales bacterium]
MKTHTTQIISLLLITFLISGCYTQKPIKIQVLKPAELNIPANIHNISVAYKIINTKGKDESLYYVNQSGFEDTDNLDSVFTKQAALYFSHSVSDSEKYTVQNSSEIHKLDDRYWSTDKDTIMKICQKDQSDAVIILNQFITREFAFHSYDYGYLFPTIYVVKNIHWQMYLNDGITHFNYYDKDTLTLENYEYYDPESIPLNFNRQYIIDEVAYLTAEEFKKQISPIWKEEERKYIHNTKFSKASDFAKNEMWKDAAKEWMPFTKSENNFRKAAAAYNMALAAEMEGNLELAIFWINIAITNDPEEDYQAYKNILLRRRNEVRQLEKQL